MKAFLGVVLTLFVVLAVLASRFPYFELDVRLARVIQSITLPGFKTLMIGISWAGSGWVPWVLTCATGSVLMLFRLRLEAVLCVAGVGTGAAVNELLKVLIARPRPTEGVVEVLIKYRGQSFPSGHVVFFVVYCGFLVFLAFALLKPGAVRKVFLAVLSLPILLGGISRVYLGAHWPSDVTGGYLAGGILLALMIAVYCRRRGGPPWPPNLREPQEFDEVRQVREDISKSFYFKVTNLRSQIISNNFKFEIWRPGCVGRHDVSRAVRRVLVDFSP